MKIRQKYLLKNKIGTVFPPPALHLLRVHVTRENLQWFNSLCARWMADDILPEGVHGPDSFDDSGFLFV